MSESGTPIVLSLNSGSSSLKFALFDMASGGEQRIAEGAAEGIGRESGRLWYRMSRGEGGGDRPVSLATHDAAVAAVFWAVGSVPGGAPAAFGHRVVHGGPDHVAPALLGPELLETLRRAIPFAPLHLPDELRCIEAVTARYPGLPQVVCFDTAFHRTLPEIARRLPLPRALDDAGVRRYGFHGLSYEYVVATLGPASLGRAVLAHLGSGASMAAVRGGVSVDTSMGFTPAGGLMMATRPGDLDPGLFVYLMDRGMTLTEFTDLIQHRSGLLGVSDSSSDMKTLLARRSADPRAALAVDIFCYQARKYIGAFAAALGGIDTLVFTGGIGERAAAVREEICDGLQFLGIVVDRARNHESAERISADGNRPVVRVVRTDEEAMIARHTRRIVWGG